MGTQTFGKGSVQSVIDLEDGSGLKLTVARYFTPKHRSIQELGISPDVVVEGGAPSARLEEGPGEKDLDRHFKNGAGSSPATAVSRSAGAASDYQLHTAVDYLRAASIFKATQPPVGTSSAKR
jgi:carboxyl-terminal processing protease